MKATLSPYDNRTENTRARITGGTESYTPNKICKSIEGSFYYYINTKGYFHILKPRKVKYNGVFHHYEVCDYLLTKRDTLKEVDSLGNYKTLDETVNFIKEGLYNA